MRQQSPSLQLSNRQLGDKGYEGAAYFLVDFKKSLSNGLFRAEVDAGKLSALDGVKPPLELVKYLADNLIHELLGALVGTLHATDGQTDRHCSPGQASADVALAGDPRSERSGKSL